jgi:acetolactate synthase regulatory subunit
MPKKPTEIEVNLPPEKVDEFIQNVKTQFAGEGNPANPGPGVLDVARLHGFTVGHVEVKTVSDAERKVLKTVLDRDRTGKIVHGGLKALLNLTDEDAHVLISFLKRI